jgi:hypothetical protein
MTSNGEPEQGNHYWGTFSVLCGKENRSTETGANLATSLENPDDHPDHLWRHQVKHESRNNRGDAYQSK